ITYKNELKLAITDKIGRRLDDIKKTHLFSETATNQFLKMVVNVEQERMRQKIRPLDSDKIAFLISELFR
ncbi:8885_t:CDS:2, partial [Dentiscutata erythropus]